MALPSYIVTSSSPVSDVADATVLAGTGGAATVGIADAGGYFSGSTVEAALQEIGAGSISFPVLYLGVSTTDGTWRIIKDGNNLVFQRRESGVYVTKSSIAP